MGNTRKQAPAFFEIRVQGELDQTWVDWFCGMTIKLEGSGGDTSITTLTGPVADQSALRGMLCKLWDLNLTLISVRPIEADTDSREEGVNVR